jgi:hypothetical protein
MPRAASGGSVRGVTHVTGGQERPGEKVYRAVIYNSFIYSVYRFHPAYRVLGVIPSLIYNLISSKNHPGSHKT